MTWIDWPIQYQQQPKLVHHQQQKVQSPEAPLNGPFPPHHGALWQKRPAEQLVDLPAVVVLPRTRYSDIITAVGSPTWADRLTYSISTVIMSSHKHLMQWGLFNPDGGKTTSNTVVVQHFSEVHTCLEASDILLTQVGPCLSFLIVRNLDSSR